MSQFEEDQAVGGGEMKTGKAAIAERKKKRREGQVWVKTTTHKLISVIEMVFLKKKYFFSFLATYCSHDEPATSGLFIENIFFFITTCCMVSSLSVKWFGLLFDWLEHELNSLSICLAHQWISVSSTNWSRHSRDLGLSELILRVGHLL